MGIRIKRAYDPPEEADGARLLVDALWPRGISREQLHIVAWLRELAPSTALRKWYQHDPEKWPEFKRRYFTELEPHQALLQQIAWRARAETITLVYASRETRLNNAAALRARLEAMVGTRRRGNDRRTAGWR